MPSLNLTVIDNNTTVKIGLPVRLLVEITGIKPYNPYLLEFRSSNGLDYPMDLSYNEDSHSLQFHDSSLDKLPGQITYYVTLKDKNTGSINYSNELIVTLITHVELSSNSKKMASNTNGAPNVDIEADKGSLPAGDTVKLDFNITNLSPNDEYYLMVNGPDGTNLRIEIGRSSTTTRVIPVSLSRTTPGLIMYEGSLWNKRTGIVVATNGIYIEFTNRGGGQKITASNSSSQSSSSRFPGQQQGITFNPDGSIKYSGDNPNSSSNTSSTSLNSSTYNNLSNLGSIISAPKCPSCPTCPEKIECTDSTIPLVTCGCVILALLILLFVVYKKGNKQQISE